MMNSIGINGPGPFGYKRVTKTQNFFTKEQANDVGKIILLDFMMKMGCGGNQMRE